MSIIVSFKYCSGVPEVTFITIYQRIQSLTDQNLWDGKGNIQHRNQHHNNVSLLYQLFQGMKILWHTNSFGMAQPLLMIIDNLHAWIPKRQTDVPYRMIIYRAFNLATWLRVVKSTESNISEFWFLNFNHKISYHWEIVL